jgi:hypothetical protein
MRSIHLDLEQILTLAVRRFPAVALAGLLLGAGCVSGPARHPVPTALTAQAHLTELPGVRMIMDTSLETWPAVRASLAPVAARASNQLGPLTLLAISGGGANGAFGAGVLNGWSKTGTRPSFDIVAGISTGALISPFAFLGTACDQELKQAYTTITDKDIYRRRNVFSILKHWDAAADSGPLLAKLHKQFDTNMLAAIAAEHRKGRRLYVGTTDMDAQVLVAWDMGAIAASGHPRAHEIFCRVLLASASIPAAFPPVYFDVEADGRRFREMHADGGVMTQVFGFAFLGQLRDLSGRREGRMYVLRNAYLTPEWKEIKPSLTAIAGRAISTLTKTQGIGDVYRAYLVAQQSQIDFNVASIPAGFHYEDRKGEFDTVYMNKLFEAGYERAESGRAWIKEPPGLDFMRAGRILAPQRPN